jgi:hypothetical protein
VNFEFTLHINVIIFITLGFFYMTSSFFSTKS